MPLIKKVIGCELLLLLILMLICGCQDDNPGQPSNIPPYTPYAPMPTDGSTGRSVQSDLFWRCGDADGDLLTYTIYFDSTETPEFIIADHPDTMYALGTLAGNTTYYWRIVARDQPGDSTAGPLWTFTTGAGANYPPAEPSNPSPPNNATEVPIHPILTWVCSDPNEGDFLSYNVYFDTSSVPSLAGYQLNTASFGPGLLDPNTEYFWKVVAYDNQGDSTTGPLWSFTTGQPAEGVFAAFTISRMLDPSGDSLLATDEIIARFDSAYAPGNPVTPLQPEGVACNEFELVWDVDHELYKYIDPVNLSFIELDNMYIFDVSGTPSVPAISDSVRFPNAETYITSPEQSDTVDISGFPVTWSSTGEGSVRFMILADEDTTNVLVETENDGAYTFTAADLEPLAGQAGNYSILIIHQVETAITTSGYDSRSYIGARVMNTVQVYIQ